MKQRLTYKDRCERCIHFKDNRDYLQSITGLCSKRNKVVNKGGIPCKWYELPLKWWQKLIRKWVQR